MTINSVEQFHKQFICIIQINLSHFVNSTLPILAAEIIFYYRNVINITLHYVPSIASLKQLNVHWIILKHN